MSTQPPAIELPPAEANAPESGSIDMLRMDLAQSLRQSVLDPRTLSSFQRILLTTDGTVTDILEAQYWESIQIIKVFQGLIDAERDVPYLEMSAGAPVLLRKVLLRGKTTHKNYIYAESVTVIDRLNPSVKDGLLKTRKPIGQLMLEARLETYREILGVRLIEAGEIGQYFDLPVHGRLISRTYRVFSDHRAIMLITESFPESSFRE